MSVCTEEEMEEAPWPATYIRLSKLPKYWIVAFLKNRFARLSAEQADMISEKHGALMMEVFWYATGTGVALSFPRGTHDKRVCSQVFAARCVEVGERLRKLEDHLAKCLAGKHKFDWQEHGIYRLEKLDKGGRVAHILHCSGAKASRVITCWGGSPKTWHRLGYECVFFSNFALFMFWPPVRRSQLLPGHQNSEVAAMLWNYLMLVRPSWLFRHRLSESSLAKF